MAFLLWYNMSGFILLLIVAIVVAPGTGGIRACNPAHVLPLGVESSALGLAPLFPPPRLRHDPIIIVLLYTHSRSATLTRPQTLITVSLGAAR
jgi:hypothetical protein